MMTASTPAITWNGSQQESFDLVNAVARNCQCEFAAAGTRISTCSPHRMLIEDQRALNGLLFARRIAERLQGEEWRDDEEVGPRTRRKRPHRGVTAAS